MNPSAAADHFKAVLKDVAPPVLVRGLRRLRTRLGRAQTDWEYVPEGWERARAGGHVRGWNVAAAAEAHRRQWPRWVKALEGPGPLGVDYFRPFREDMRDGDLPRDLPWAHNAVMSYAYVLARAADGKARLSLLDWGGGVGQYFPLSRALLADVEIEYHCKELPEFAAVGRELTPEAHFYSDDAAWTGRTYDLVLASSALHNVEDWQGALAQLAAVTGGYLFVTRLPTIVRHPSYVALQRADSYGWQTEFLLWHLNRNAFLAEAERLGLVLEREFVMMDTTPVAGAPEQASYRGFLFRPRRRLEGEAVRDADEHVEAERAPEQPAA